jgi:uncharacterized protein YcbX
MHVSKLFIYPIKSCAPVAVDSLSFDRYGPQGDRRFMLVDHEGKFLTQRALPKMAHITPELVYSDGGGLQQLNVSASGYPELIIPLEDQQQSEKLFPVSVWKDTLPAQDCGEEAAAWFSSFLNQDCRLVILPADSQRQVDLTRAEPGRYVGFADGYPLLVVSQASLDFLSDKVGRQIHVERFRPNIVIEGSEAFAEQEWRSLLLEQGQLDLVKRCERCVIPTRNMETLEREADVLDILKQYYRIDGRIIFGQNAIEKGVNKICLSDQVKVI